MGRAHLTQRAIITYPLQIILVPKTNQQEKVKIERGEKEKKSTLSACSGNLSAQLKVQVCHLTWRVKQHPIYKENIIIWGERNNVQLPHVLHCEYRCKHPLNTQSITATNKRASVCLTLLFSIVTASMCNTACMQYCLLTDYVLYSFGCLDFFVSAQQFISNAHFALLIPKNDSNPSFHSLWITIRFINICK